MLRALPLLLLLAAGAAWCQSARASCGDWLAHPASSAEQATKTLEDQPGSRASDASALPGESASAATPVPCDCTGPQCGQSPLTSPSSPAVPPQHRMPELACGPLAAIPSPLHSERLLHCRCRLLSSQYVPSIDRPPRI